MGRVQFFPRQLVVAIAIKSFENAFCPSQFVGRDLAISISIESLHQRRGETSAILLFGLSLRAA
jgi:hypothetical protein